jgi:long-chain acyl-CoA synthetase
MKEQKTLNGYLAQAIRDNWDTPALTDFRGITYQYRDVAHKIAKLHILFEESGLKPGDKIAFCGRNCAEWAIAVLASLTYGTVAVPILHDFKPDNIHHLVNHSESRLFFADAATWDNLDPDTMGKLDGAVLINDYSLLLSRNKKLTKARENLNRLFGERYPERFSAADVSYPEYEGSQLALINYTSGSTGFSKGVMLSYGNLWSNLQFCIDGLTFLKAGDGMVSMLPLAHMYGLMVEFIHTFAKGCHIYFLTRTPSPQIIMEAFAQVRPKLIVAVPLIIEKIVKTRIFPLLEKPLMKLAMHLPFVDNKLLEKIKEQLEKAFGGQLKEIIIGGAGLNADVEAFLRRIKFPFTVGYGMTECGPLIGYCPWDKQRPASCGLLAPRMEGRVDTDDPEKTPGVLWVRGANVMLGYYKNPEATEAVMGADGWMNTGDICNIDADGYLYIRGRDKNMILGPSGQNIYPEEIEQKLNNMPYVAESIIIGNDGRLTALIYPDIENAGKQGIAEGELQKIMQENISALNKELPSYSQISGLKIFHEEFEKTPKRSIKRYLYQ